jgi:hypothetical protein
MRSINMKQPLFKPFILLLQRFLFMPYKYLQYFPMESAAKVRENIKSMNSNYSQAIWNCKKEHEEIMVLNTNEDGVWEQKSK